MDRKKDKQKLVGGKKPNLTLKIGIGK